MLTGREYTECETWREESLRRIEAAATPHCVMSGDTAYTPYDADRRHELSGEARAGGAGAGYAATLSADPPRGPADAVIKDTAAARPSDVPSCVSEELQNLDTCAFPPRPRRHRVRRRAAAAHAGSAPDRRHRRDLPRRPLPGGDRQRPRLPRQEPPDRDLRATLSPWIERGLREAGLV